MKIGNAACKAWQLALWERATALISSSNNLVRDGYSTALFSLNSTLWHRSESCILKSLGYMPSTLDSYWLDRNHVPYFIYVDDVLAGFALIRPYPTSPDRLDVEQFFVLRKYKGQGVGKEAFEEILNIHPGKWQIRVLKENEPALAFWKSVVSHRVGENFEVCIDIDIDLEMHFIRFDTE
ncbi:GNAT family N-acetyltransferase [Vibrio caribbeanicus]|uniref:GCN5-related N-acetyltransferase n=1 Tax=Vibrio caribbeanicus ATCC BAA-2122 TaxID=796620 RepID=E3BEP2_9VIBR|nr:GNAT family N-acetyltransferase [Vibrio caribbeanicus]EFP98409.1 GCN5-related N-acetyltransferase [Vibrio caribbeanicus ATCC BAA-2122]